MMVITSQRLSHLLMLSRRIKVCKNQWHIISATRCLHSTSLNLSQAVKLSYQVHKGSLLPEQPIVMMHGLLGTGRNFTAIAKQLVTTTKRTVVTVDARNHGNSEHSDVMNYDAMVSDMINVLHELQAKCCIPIGHSLGGRTAMSLALANPEFVDKFVSIDVSPSFHGGNNDVLTILLEMKKFQMPKGLSLVQTRQLASRQFAPVMPKKDTRDFILTNLVERNGEIMWRVNLNAILNNRKSTGNINENHPPYTTGRALFIGGTDSNFITVDDHPNIARLFPTSEVKMIEGAGHWVHHEKPQEICDLLTEFINTS